jgi:phage minor structural protein
VVYIIIVKDKNMIELGILENAYDIGVQRTVNEVWQSSFSLPKSDPKNALCSHMNYIDITSDTERYYGLYRIMPTETIKGANIDTITYKCEHVLSTLMDDVIDGYFQLSGYNTAQALQAILDLQETERWVLGQVDFVKYFEYNFENENGLLAPILSIPKPFSEAYEFTFNTQSYPWTLNIIAAINDVKAEIRWGKDMTDFNEVSDPTDIVNYIIPKGTGEGINQLTIAPVNGGLKYLKDDASIAEWGKRSYIWIDKSFENAQLLKDSAQSLLNQWKDPKISFTVGSADLSILPECSQERKVLNGITRIIVDDEEYLARIVGEDISDISREYEVSYQINNKLDDIATTQADTERKQQVSEAYSQGATNIYSFTYQDNCDQYVPAHISFYVDDDVVNVNTCELTFETKKYRGYNGVGSFLIDPSTGTTSSDDGTGLHDHTFNIPGHAHAVTAKVTEYEIDVSSVQIVIDGNTVPGTGQNMERINIVPYLSKTSGAINRGRHGIDIRPNNPARVEANVILRVFIQSRIGGVY